MKKVFLPLTKLNLIKENTLQLNENFEGCRFEVSEIRYNYRLYGYEDANVAQPFFGFITGEVVVKPCGSTHNDYRRLYQDEDLFMIGRIWSMEDGNTFAVYIPCGKWYQENGMPSQTSVRNIINQAFNKTELYVGHKYYVNAWENDKIIPIHEEKQHHPEEQDEFTIGDEGNGSMGVSHVIQEIYRRGDIDFDEVDEIRFSTWFDEDEFAAALGEVIESEIGDAYQDCYEFKGKYFFSYSTVDEEGEEYDEEQEIDLTKYSNFIKEWNEENLNFDVDFYNRDYEYMGNLQTTLDMMDFEGVPDELIDLIRDEYTSNPNQNEWVIREILYNMYSNDPDIYSAAKKLFPTYDEYFEGLRGFILQDGIIVGTEYEHNEITQLYGVESKFDFIRMGNIRIMPNSVDIGAEPTWAQREVLRKIINTYSDSNLYLDIFSEKGETGCEYYHPNWREVLADIDRYYEEGIKPTGGHGGMYESKNIIKENITDVVYHFTTLYGLIGILNNDEFETKLTRNDMWAFSFTRQRTSKIGYAAIDNTASLHQYDMNQCVVRLTINGRELGYNYKSVPYNHFYSKYDETSAKANMTIEPNNRNNFVESEDCVLSYERTIPNASRYIEKIDILFRPNFHDGGRMFEEYYNELEELSDLGFYADVYFDEEEFNKLNGRGMSISRAMMEIQDMMYSGEYFDDEELDENINYEVAPADIDTSSFELENTLEPNVWDKDGNLNSMVRLKLLDIADDFIDTLNIRWVKPTDIILTGSLCNFNWSEYSDFDLHVLMDFSEVDERTELVKSYFDAKKNEWNENHDTLEIHGYPVELYVQDVNDENISSGIYSLEKNKWLIEPKEDCLEDLSDVDDVKIKMIGASIMTYIDEIEDKFKTEHDSHKIEELKEEIDEVSSKVKDIRSKSLSDNGEMGVGNLVYKLLRRRGYLDKIYDLKNKIYDKLNSIE